MALCGDAAHETNVVARCRDLALVTQRVGEADRAGGVVQIQGPGVIRGGTAAVERFPSHECDIVIARVIDRGAVDCHLGCLRARAGDVEGALGNGAAGELEAGGRPTVELDQQEPQGHHAARPAAADLSGELALVVIEVRQSTAPRVPDRPSQWLGSAAWR